ncbi:thioredoxin domain-containing protein [Flindersiella endophytica]
MLVGLLCSLDLILTVGVIRRLRDHSGQLSAIPGMPGSQPSLGVGDPVGDFTSTDVDGQLVSNELLKGETLVAFLSAGCAPCKDKLPLLVEYARSAPAGRDGVLAVVLGVNESDEEFVAGLRPVARVVVEEHRGAMSMAFQANRYPSILMVAPTKAGQLTVRVTNVDLTTPSVAA